jgi:hypothetical protein
MFMVKIAHAVGRSHAKFFMWLGKKSEENPWFSVLLSLLALYEVAEHLLGPAMALLFASGHLELK